MQSYMMSIDRDMLQIARRQFCLDVGLDWQQYLEQPDKKVYIQRTRYADGTRFPAMEGARCYGDTDAFFKAIICMGQLFLSVDEQIYDWAVEQFGDCEPEWFCEYGNLRRLDKKLQEYGCEIKDTHVYFLSGIQGNRPIGNGNDKSQDDFTGVSEFDFISYGQEEILRFKDNNCFTRALSFWENQPDVLAVAAVRKSEGKTFDQSQMSGMAGASADGAYLWQIGINVVSESAGKGLAVELVRRVRNEIVRRGKVPFYGTSESHIISQTVGLKAGFVPAWTEIYVKRIEK